MAPIWSHFFLSKQSVAPKWSHFGMEVKTIWKTKSAHCPGGSSWSPALTVVNISSLILRGTFAATIACKRWNKSRNLLVYLDLDDGRKIITATWNKDNFFGLADMPVGTRVSVRFKTAVSTGKTYLNYAEQE